MYIVLSGCAQQGASSPPLAASIDGSSLQDMADMSAPATGSVVTFTTPIGALDATVIATGGTGAYQYSWSVSKTNENSDNGNRFSVASAGTTNLVRYNTLTINGARAATGGGAPWDGEFEATCTVDDGITTVTATAVFTVVAAS